MISGRREPNNPSCFKKNVFASAKENSQVIQENSKWQTRQRSFCHQTALSPCWRHLELGEEVRCPPALQQDRQMPPGASGQGRQQDFPNASGLPHSLPHNQPQLLGKINFCSESGIWSQLWRREEGARLPNAQLRPWARFAPAGCLFPSGRAADRR